MKTKKRIEWNKVTPLSKYLAMALFIALPFGGFWMGMKYQQNINVDTVLPTDTSPLIESESMRQLINRCGDLPDDIPLLVQKPLVLVGPYWAPDCRNIAWSIYLGGMGGVKATLDKAEGLYLFNDATHKIIKIYSPEIINEVVTYRQWIDRNTVEFTVQNGGEKILRYNVVSGNVEG